MLKYSSGFQKSLPALFFSLFSLSAYSAELVLKTGFSGETENLTEAQMTDLSQTSALANLKSDHKEYTQVSAWQNDVSCLTSDKPWETCESGWSYSTASFIETSKLNEEWTVKTSGSSCSSFSGYSGTYSDGECLTEALHDATEKAKYYCHSEVVLPALQVETHILRAPYFQMYLADAQFKCLK